MKRKKFWIVFGSCCLSVVLLCTVFALVFRLKTVDIEIGKPGQALVQDIRWIRDAQGIYKLVVLEVE